MENGGVNEDGKYNHAVYIGHIGGRTAMENGGVNEDGKYNLAVRIGTASASSQMAAKGSIDGKSILHMEMFQNSGTRCSYSSKTHSITNCNSLVSQLHVELIDESSYAQVDTLLHNAYRLLLLLGAHFGVPENFRPLSEIFKVQLAGNQNVLARVQQWFNAGQAAHPNPCSTVQLLAELDAWFSPNGPVHQHRALTPIYSRITAGLAQHRLQCIPSARALEDEFLERQRRNISGNINHADAFQMLRKAISCKSDEDKAAYIDEHVTKAISRGDRTCQIWKKVYQPKLSTASRGEGPYADALLQHGLKRQAETKQQGNVNKKSKQ